MRLKLSIFAFSAAFAIGVAPGTVAAQEKPATVPAKDSSAGEKPAAPGSPAAPDAAAKAAGDKANKQPGFRGKIASVDQAAKTFTIEGKKKPRTFHVSESTKIVKGKTPATFADIAVGKEVRGSHKKEAGKLDVISLNLEPKPAGEAKAPDAAATPGKVKDPATVKDDKTQPNAAKP